MHDRESVIAVLERIASELQRLAAVAHAVDQPVLSHLIDMAIHEARRAADDRSDQSAQPRYKYQP